MTTDHTPPTDQTETARALLWRHGVPEDVIDGALCLHRQELAADQTALRDRIAEALMRWAEDNNAPQYASVRRPETVVRNAYSRADAVVAVLPPPADRAAILREAADQYAKLADQNEAYELAEHGSIDHETRLQYEAVRDVVAGLRRMADETQPDPCGRTTSVTRDEYPPCARSAGHPEAYCRSADGKTHFLALYGPRPPAAERQDGAQP